MGMRNHLYKISLFFQILYNSFSCFITLHPGVLSALFIDGRVVVHNIDLWKIMTFSYFKVIRIVGGSNLNRAGSKFFIYIIICHNRNLSIHQRQKSFLSYDIFISLIIRMNRDRSIAKHGLRPGCRNLKELFCSYDRVLNMPEEPVLFLMFNLRIRQRSLTYRTPVDNPRSSIDIPFLIESYEYFFNGFGTSLVHGKPFSVPVAGYA